MTPLRILLAAVFLGTGNCVLKSFTGAFSSNGRLDVREVYAKSVGALLRYFRMNIYCETHKTVNTRYIYEMLLCCEK